MKGLIGGRIVTEHDTVNFKNVAAFVGLEEGDEDNFVFTLNCGSKKKDPYAYKAQFILNKTYAEWLRDTLDEFLSGAHSFNEDEEVKEVIPNIK